MIPTPGRRCPAPARLLYLGSLIGDVLFSQVVPERETRKFRAGIPAARRPEP